MINTADIILGVVILLLLIFQAIERRDLYNRIMSRDLGDYQGHRSRDKPKSIKSRHEQVLEAWRRKE